MDARGTSAFTRVFDALLPAHRMCLTTIRLRGRLASLGLRRGNADRAAHARAAEAAIAHRILRQILLVVVLGEIEWRSIADFGGNRAKALRLELLAVDLFRCFRGPALVRGEGIDTRAILCAHVVALAQALRGVVILPKCLEQPLIADLLRIEDHEHHLVVAGAAGANLLVGRIGRMTARIPDRSDVNAFAQFPKLALGAPEAAHPEHCQFEARRVWPLQRLVKNEMLPRGGDRCRAAGQRLGRGRHFKLLIEHEHATSPLVLSQYSGGGARAHRHWTPLTHHLAARPGRGPRERDQRARRPYIARAGETLCCGCMMPTRSGDGDDRLEETAG